MYKVQELYEGHWLAHDNIGNHNIDGLIELVEGFYKYNTKTNRRGKYRVFDYSIGKVVYE